jgi:hypothetical protein
VPHELRYILFSTEEVHSAIVRFLQTRGPRRRPSTVRHVSLFAGGPGRGVVAEARLAGDPPCIQRLENDDLIIALLDMCRSSRIPLPRESHKSLELSEGRLVLVTGVNPVKIPPLLVDGQIKHAEWALRSVYPATS